MSYKSKIDFILKFKEGDYLIAGGVPYFMPKGGSSSAYQGYGEKKELMGKFSHSLKSQSEAVRQFTLTYEVEDGELISARLISGDQRSKGELADAALVQKLNADLQNGTLELKSQPRPPYISRAAQFGDGRVLLLVENLENEDRHVLYVGKPGEMEMVRLHNGIQGGSSFYYTAENGKKVALPYGLGGPRSGETPQYGDEFLSYIDVKDPGNFAAFGIKVKNPEPHLDPFMPESRSKNPAFSARPAFRR